MLGFLASIPLSLLISFYSGLVFARVSPFESIRHEVLRIIRAVDYGDSRSDLKVVAGKNITELLLISSSLFTLGHKTAGELVGSIFDELNLIIYCGGPVPSYDEMGAKMARWQEAVRTMKPSFRAIFGLRPKV